MTKRPSSIGIRGEFLKDVRESNGWTREALAAELGASDEKSYVNLTKAIQRMETKSLAQRTLVEKACQVLGVSFAEVRLDQFVTILDPRGFDIRSAAHPYDKESSEWQRSRPMITISELSLQAHRKACSIKYLSVSMPLFGALEFSWLYHVGLNAGGQSWLGDPKDITRLHLNAGERWSGEIMCGLSDLAVPEWHEVVRALQAQTSDVPINLTLVNEFGVRIERKYHLSHTGIKETAALSNSRGFEMPPVFQLYEAGFKRSHAV